MHKSSPFAFIFLPIIKRRSHKIRINAFRRKAGQLCFRNTKEIITVIFFAQNGKWEMESTREVKIKVCVRDSKHEIFES